MISFETFRFPLVHLASFLIVAVSSPLQNPAPLLFPLHKFSMSDLSDSKIRLLRLPKLIDGSLFARKTAGVGASPREIEAAPSGLTGEIKVLGIFISRASASASETGLQLYFRVSFGKSVVVMLPLEVMRQEYPQVLIDYLLSTAVWDS
jgi:hypothetical protein